MDRRLATALALVLAAVAVLLLLFARDEASPDLGVPHGTGRSQEDGAVRLAADDLGGASDGDAARSALASEAAVPKGAAASDLATLRGAVVRSDGTPATDARVTLFANLPDEVRLALRAAGTPWKDRETNTDANGAFEFRFDPPNGSTFDMWIQAPMAVRGEAGEYAVARGDVVDVGTIELQSGGAIAGRFVKPDGSPVRGKFRASASTRIVRPDGSRARIQDLVEVDPLDGTFRFDGVAAGRVELRITTAGSVLQEEQKVDVEVAAGETTLVEVVLRGADPATLIQVDASPRDWSEAPLEAALTLTDDRGRVLAPTKSSTWMESTRWQFGEIEPGLHTVRIDDDRYELFERFDVEAGDMVDVRLRGSVVVELVALDAATGEPVVPDAVRVASLPIESGAGLRSKRPLAPLVEGSNVYRTVPMPQGWYVEAAGYAPLVVEVPEGFAPRSEGRLVARLERERTITGRVVRANGEPLQGIEVAARESVGPKPPRGEVEALAAWIERRNALPVVVATTDVDGRFELGPLSTAAYDLATRLPVVVAAYAFDVVAEGEVELVAPPFGTLAGRFEPLFPAVKNCTLRLDPDELEVASADDDAARLEGLVDSRASLGSGSMRAGGSRPITCRPANGRSSSSPRDPHDRGPSSPKFGGRRLDPIRFEIVDGETTEIAIDAGDDLPGVANVTVWKSGKPAPGLLVVALDPDAPEGTRPSGAGLTDGEGVARVTPLHAGTWRFEVRAQDASFSVDVPGTFEVGPGATLELDASITPTRGRVVFTDAQGAPLADVLIGIAQFDPLERWRATDAEGGLDLELMPGTYEVLGARARGEGVQPGAPLFAGGTFEWSASGPVEGTLTLGPLPGDDSIARSFLFDHVETLRRLRPRRDRHRPLRPRPRRRARPPVRAIAGRLEPLLLHVELASVEVRMPASWMQTQELRRRWEDDASSTSAPWTPEVVVDGDEAVAREPRPGELVRTVAVAPDGRSDSIRARRARSRSWCGSPVRPSLSTRSTRRAAGPELAPIRVVVEPERTTDVVVDVAAFAPAFVDARVRLDDRDGIWILTARGSSTTGHGGPMGASRILDAEGRATIEEPRRGAGPSRRRHLTARRPCPSANRATSSRVRASSSGTECGSALRSRQFLRES
ncbi:MAG: hypothetical protein R3F34_08270 [Planctomycetota bacterium]